MLGIISGLLTVAVSVNAATTTTGVPSTMEMMTTTEPDMPAIIYYDFEHNTAMIVRTDGCYEYHLNHQDELDAQDETARPVLEARMLDELSRATNVQEMGHNHVNHMTQEIVDACTALPIYSWEATR